MGHTLSAGPLLIHAGSAGHATARSKPQAMGEETRLLNGHHGNARALDAERRSVFPYAAALALHQMRSLMRCAPLTPPSRTGHCCFQLPPQYLPLIFVAGAVGLCAAFKQFAQLPFVLLGAFSAWLYLRFFQQQADSQHRGDASDDFKFSGFFPPILAPVIDPFGLACATVFRLRHAPAETKAPFAAVSQFSLGSDAADASRRRCGAVRCGAGGMGEGAPACRQLLSAW